ncbi:metabotropic glutamate receptor 3 [Elysia marginata]|uniref:Metabotropic glutamate receptor 3 n=1 Tax=Elysia marginata TaxID=1093978 RepID=A0AAV4JAZ4_9GAST|nr:metabotropic glutamate receptor 3 [Elysia marginata]
MQWALALSIVLMVGIGQGQKMSMQVCSKDMVYTDVGTNANVIIGGIFEMRQPGTNGFGCGPVTQGLMQVFEASRFTISALNRANYIPGVTFGMRVYDTCREKSVALKALQELYPQTTSSNLFCSQNNDLVLGVVGPLSSITAVPTAEYASSVPASLISPRAANPLLSDKTRFPTFLRTVPSMSVLSRATVELLKAMKWEDNILLIYSDDEYGRSGYKQLLEAANIRGICFVKAIALNPTHLTKDSAKAALEAAIGGRTYNAGVMVMDFVEGKKTLEAIDEIPSLASTQWVLSDFDITTDYNNLRRSRGALIVTPSSPTLDDFKTFFALEENNVSPTGHPENPWFIDWYERKYSCWIKTPSSLPQCNSQGQATLEANFVQSPFAVPTMKAIAAYAEAVRLRCDTTLGTSCVNQLRSVSPSDFHDTLRNLDVTFPANYPIVGLRGKRVKFDANGDLDSYDCSVYNHRGQPISSFYDKVGEFKNNVLTLRKPLLFDSLRTRSLAINPEHPCPTPDGCTNCLKPPVSTVFRFSPGDLIIASLANGHKTGRFPFTCGEAEPARLAALVAAEWAVSRYKSQNSDKLRQVTLGSLAVDICPDGLVTGGFINDLLSGNSRLMGPSMVMADNIRGFVDYTDGTQAKMISPVLAQFKIPEIQTESVHTMGDGSSMMPMMRDDDQAAFTVQAVPSDHMMHEAIASVLLRMGWKYVQIATHNMGMYNSAAHDFRMMAGRHGICVVEVVDTLDSADVNRFTRAVTRLRGRPDAAVVVVFAERDAVRGLLTAIQNQGAVGQLQLVAGTEKWAKNSDYITGVENGATGFLSVGLEMSEVVAFTTWLSSLSSSEIAAHPFLRDWFEMSNQCSLGPTTSGRYSRACGSSDNIDTNGMSALGKLPYVIQSVYTMANKLHEVIQEVCTSNYIGLCASFRSAGDIGTRLRAKLRNVSKLSNGYGIKDGKSSTSFVFYQYSARTFNQFAVYSNENRRLESLNTNQLSSVPGATTCAGPCLECQYLFALQSGVFMPGDWLVAGIFSVSNSGPVQYRPYVCGDIRTSNGPQYTTAMMYALQQVNNGAAPVSVKGVTFGGITLDHCNNPGRANLLTSSIYSSHMLPTGLDEGNILSWLTDNTGATQEVEALLDPLGVAVVSPSATNMDLMDYSNFYRTIQGDQTAAMALIKIIKSQQFPYFQVVYSDSGYGEGALKVLQNVAQMEGICITNSVKVSSTDAAAANNIASTLVASETDVVVFFTGTAHTKAVLEAIARNTNARGSLFILLAEPYESIVSTVAPQMRHKIMSLRLQTSVLQNYNNFINSSPVTNPYFAQYYMKLMECNLPGFSKYLVNCPEPLQDITSATDYAPNNFVLSTINAVYATVDALDRTVRDYCGDSYTQPCRNFLFASDMRSTFNRNLANVNFVDESGRSFRFLEREGNVVYDVLQSGTQGSYRKVGTYAGVSLNLDSADLTSYSSIASLCSAPCLSCVMRGLNFSHTPGDIYLAGVFDVHKFSTSPFTCGDINTVHGFLLLEAFHYALNQVNEKKGQFANILNGVKLGGIGIDACQSQIRGAYLVSNINNGNTVLQRDGVMIDPTRIDAYVGSYGSRASIYLAQVLNDLEIPQISFGAGSPDLSDDRYYPYFYRTIPSDMNMVDAILKFLDSEDIRYVQVVFEDTFNAVATKDYFLEKASANRICVAQVVDYPDVSTISDEVATTVVSKLSENPAANTVVTFVSTELIPPMLRAAQRSSQARGKLRFFGSTDWADNQEAILGTGAQAFNSITVRLDSDDVVGFENYINTRTLANSDENPWFGEYYQAIHNCYISKLNRMGYSDQCSPALSDIILQPSYQQDQGVAFVMDAVYAAAFGLHETLKKKCRENYSGVCQAYHTDQNRHKMLKDELKDVSFKDPLDEHFQFVNRSGNYNYRYYSIDNVLGVPTYTQIGRYNATTKELSISPSYMNQVNSDCQRKDACSECPLIRDNSKRYVVLNQNPNEKNQITIVAFFDIHKQGVDPYRCGDINPEGFQQFAALNYALQKVLFNQSPVRMIAIDTCSNSLRVDQDLYGLLAGDGLCNSMFSVNDLSVSNLGGVITLGELNTMAAGRVLETPGVTYLSPNALSPILDGHKHLVRSIAPWSAMMKALSKLLEDLGLTYVDVVYENNKQGYQMMYKLDFYTYDAKVCLASKLAVAEDDTNQDIDLLLSALKGNLGSKVVVLIGSHMFTKRTLDAASRLGIADDYLWILAGPWQPSEASVKLLGIADSVKIMTVSRRMWEPKDFRTFMDGLTYNSPSLIPRQWFDEFYQQVLNCTLSNSEKPLGRGRQECDISKRFIDVEWTMDPYIVNTVVAAYTLTSGISRQTNFTAREDVLKSILDSTWNMESLFKSLRGLDLSYDKQNQWWDQGHVFMAHWGDNMNFTSLDRSNATFDTVRGMLGSFSASKCLQSSEEGSCGCMVTGVSGASSLAVQASKYVPSDHRNFYRYDDDKNEKSLEWPLWTIPVGAVTCLGIIITIVLFMVLLCAYPVRGGTSILGYMSILGVLCIYVINFAFFLHASEAVCGIRRFLMGVVYMIALGPMLVKAVDNWRFSHVDKAEGRYSGISSTCSLLLAAIGLVLIQCIIPIMWLILRHPTASWLVGQDYDSRHDNWWCDPANDYDLGLVLSFSFVLFVIIITAGFCALAFDSERNNNESRWILLSCVATGGCFLVWMVVTTNAGPPYRDPAVAIANVVNATLLLITMPLRKTILMLRAKREKKKSERDAVLNRNGGPYDGTYGNPTYELGFYDNGIMDYKSEEF